jgi:hypothetical protein
VKDDLMAKRSAKRPILAMPLWMGLFCGVAVGLIVVLLPLPLVESFVEQTGLASVLPAAAPPLGQTARGLLAVTFGLVMGVSCFILLRALEGLPPIRIRAPRFKRREESAIFTDAPAEPVAEPVQVDEPRRSPIMAARDLGAPFHSITAESGKAVVASETEIASESVLELEQPLAEPDYIGPEPVGPIFARHEQPEPEIASEPGFVVARPAFVEAESVEFEPVEPEVIEPEIIEVEAVEEEAVEAEVVATEPVSDAGPGVSDSSSVPIPVSPARAAIDGSIPALVRRLETGFERRLAGRDPVQQAEPGFTSPQPDIDIALRDALGTLQRMTARSR